MAATGHQALLPSQGAARSKYSRGVCRECTRRHHKCDAVHPECTPCTVGGLTCTWPEKKGGPMQGRVGTLEAKLDAQQAEIESLKATVAALVQATGLGAQSPLLGPAQHHRPDPLVIPLTPVSSGPPSSFPSSAESSPHPAMKALPAQHGALLGIPPADHAFARGHAGMSSSSDGSFKYDGGGGSVHLDIPRRHARTLSNASSSSDSSFQYDAYTSGGSQASSPCIPALLFDPPSGWPGPAGFDGLGAPSAAGYTDVPLALNVIEAGTEPGRSSDVFNNMWGGTSGADGAGLGLGMNGNTWGNVTEDTTMGEVTVDG